METVLPRPLVAKSICCCEVGRVELKMKESENSIGCSTEHEGFPSVCLSLSVLQIAYFSYRYHCGDAEERDLTKEHAITGYH